MEEKMETNQQVYENQHLGLAEQLSQMMILLASEAGGNQELARAAADILRGSNGHHLSDLRAETGAQHEGY